MTPVTTPSKFAVACLQLLFLAGMTITIGVQATMQFFSRRKNRKVSGKIVVLAQLVHGDCIGGTCVASGLPVALHCNGSSSRLSCCVEATAQLSFTQRCHVQSKGPDRFSM
jgi:hypothetical protein